MDDWSSPPSCQGEFVARRTDRVHGRVAKADRVGRRVAHPFLENDDANRPDGLEHAAPGGADAARREKPLVGTGIGRPWPSTPGHRGASVVADRRSVDATRIVVRVNDDETSAGEAGVDIYNLIKYRVRTRTPASTSVRW